ncbi:MAG: hypothetical protein H0X46_07285, partial [Bacteroidetes bacterium]|nr:hypothetical protein [Bacteroidota bacterium]
MFRLIALLLCIVTQSLSSKLQPSERLFHSDIFNSYQWQYYYDVAPYSAELQIYESDPRKFYQQYLTMLRSSRVTNMEAYRWFFLGPDLSHQIIEDAEDRLNIRLNLQGFTQPQELAKLMERAYKETLI